MWSWLKKKLGRLTWSEVQALSLESPESVCRLVRSNVRYARDVKPTWQLPRVTWERGRGDCEDMALLVRDICRHNGLVAELVLYFPAAAGRIGHAVVEGDYRGRHWVSSNGDYCALLEPLARARVAMLLDVPADALYRIVPGEPEIQRRVSDSLLAKTSEPDTLGPRRTSA